MKVTAYDPTVDLVPDKQALEAPRKFGTLKGKIKIVDPNWAAPGNRVEASPPENRHAQASVRQAVQDLGLTLIAFESQLEDVPLIGGDSQFAGYKGLRAVW